MAVCLIALVAFLSLAMAGAWAIAMRSGKSGLIDATWTFAVGIGAVAAALWPLDDGDYGPRKWLLRTNLPSKPEFGKTFVFPNRPYSPLM